MKFSLEQSLNILERTPSILRTLLVNLNEEWIYNNEGPETWSPFDIVGHLIHGEKTDWLLRVKIILKGGPNPGFEPFDRFAQFDQSKGRSLEILLQEFDQLRSANLIELKRYNLGESDFVKIGIHPKFGQVTLKNLISSWVVHDLSHLAQISRVMAKQYRVEVGPWVEYLPILNS